MTIGVSSRSLHSFSSSGLFHVHVGFVVVPHYVCNNSAIGSGVQNNGPFPVRGMWLHAVVGVRGMMCCCLLFCVPVGILSQHRVVYFDVTCTQRSTILLCCLDLMCYREWKYYLKLEWLC